MLTSLQLHLNFLSISAIDFTPNQHVYNVHVSSANVVRASFYQHSFLGGGILHRSPERYCRKNHAAVACLNCFQHRLLYSCIQ